MWLATTVIATIYQEIGTVDHGSIITEEEQYGVDHFINLCHGIGGSHSHIHIDTQTQIYTPTNRPAGILFNTGPALLGCDQAILPMSVITTVGLTEFTRICSQCGGNVCVRDVEVCVCV